MAVSLPAKTYTDLPTACKYGFFALLALLGRWWFARLAPRKVRLARWLFESTEQEMLRSSLWLSSKDIAEQETQRMHAIQARDLPVKRFPTGTLVNMYNQVAHQGVPIEGRTTAALNRLTMPPRRRAITRPLSFSRFAFEEEVGEGEGEEDIVTEPRLACTLQPPSSTVPGWPPAPPPPLPPVIARNRPHGHMPGKIRLYSPEVERAFTQPLPSQRRVRD